MGARAPSMCVLAVVLSVTTLIVVGGLARAGEGTWSWRVGGNGSRYFDGIPMAWEWIDIADAVWFLEGDARWKQAGTGLRTDQVIRFVPAVVVPLLGGWTGNAWWASNVATLLCWLAAAAAMYALCRLLIARPGRGHRIGCVAALLVALSPGFTAYAGNIEIRPYAYAAAPLALLAVEYGWRLRWSGTAPRADKRADPIFLAVGLFVANGTLQLGPVLLAMLWLFYVILDSRTDHTAEGAARPSLTERFRWAGKITLAYVLLDVTWFGLAYVSALGRITLSTENDGWARLVSTLTRSTLEWSAFTGFLSNVRLTADPTFTAPVLALLLPGLLLLPRRAALWAATWLCIVIGSLFLMARLNPRVLYLLYPAVYLAVAAAVDRAGTLLAAWVSWRQSRAAVAIRSALRWAPSVALLYLVGRVVLADLGGDLSLARAWW